MTIIAPVPLPSPLLDALLRLAPLDVLLFDPDLICRYAAPADGTLFGRTADQLVGRPAAEIFPPMGSDLGAALTLAAQSARASQYPAYRYAYTEASTQTLYCWSVRIAPVAFLDYRGREEFRGVLVTLADVQDLADATDRLQAENDGLRQELASARQREAVARAAVHELRTTVRNLLAPAMGYLQVLSRRPRVLGGRPPAEILDGIVAPALQQVVTTVDTFDPAPPTARAESNPD